jgi:hypothetical protein
MKRSKWILLLIAGVFCALVIAVLGSQIAHNLPIIRSGGIDHRLAHSEILRRSDQVSAPWILTVESDDYRWVYRIDSRQRAVLQAACDPRFGGIKRPDCVVSEFIDVEQGSITNLELRGDHAVIHRMYDSLSAVREIADGNYVVK